MMKHGVRWGCLSAGAKVEFPDVETMKANDKKIVECSWDENDQKWLYMRTRVDKDTPNAYHVYEKVAHPCASFHCVQEEVGRTFG
jgi:mRNA capping enzyme, C-terminal domain